MNTVINKQLLVHFGGKLPRETHIAVKKYAAEHGITLNKLYDKALRGFLIEQSETENITPTTIIDSQNSRIKTKDAK
ncbi:hypothetical protein [Sphaerochaeta sp. PS]|uniref:hypothetical protein n=1 Tax=Sphaerochaeta sp. PS TaxID=3076336 RepID=UPI0028A38BE1|nr:hypothetical protein [Sphaerochaeta sp. PS]MDT4761845.1 hypothetical protein [Sphaerochaeta sp. PS]